MLTKNDKTRAQSCSCCTTTSGLERQEHGRDGKDTTDSGKKTHGDIRDTRLQVVHANVLEVETAIKSTQPSRQGDQELCEWGMHVHEELALDVLGRKSTETE